MNCSVELKELAYKKVCGSCNNWLTIGDIIKNLEEEGFIVNSTINNGSSSIFYSKDKESKKIKILLLYYSFFTLLEKNGNGFVLKNINGINGQIKSNSKKLSSLIKSYSSEKEFNEELFKDKQKLLMKERW